jgi:PAS domain S-box-containing protein
MTDTSRTWSPRRHAIWRWCLIGAALLVVVRAATPWLFPAGAQMRISTDIQGMVRTLAAMLALGWAALRVRRCGGAAAGWWLLTAAAGAWLVAELIWLYLEVMGRRPWGSLADGFFLGFYLLFVAGILALPRRATRPGPGRMLDLTIIMATGTAWLWCLAIGPALAGGVPPDGWLTLVIAVGYPIGDLLVLWAALGLASLGRDAGSVAAGRLLACAGLVLVVTDMLFSGQVLAGTYQSGNWLGILWTTALVLVGLAGTRRALTRTPVIRAPTPEDGRAPPLTHLLVVVCIAAAWILTLVASGPAAGHVPDALLGTVLALGGLRLAVALRENRRLAADLHAANLGLEERVRNRTGELELANARLAAEIGEREHAQAELREREESYRTLFDAAGDALFVHDAASGRILDANQAAERLIGASRAEIARADSGLRFNSDEPGFTLADAQARVRRAVSEGPQHFEWRGRDAAGHARWLEVVLKHVVIGGRDLVIASARDIDDRKRAEEQLRQMQRMESIGRLAGGVAHDFNNMLAGIHGAAELLALELKAGDPRRANVELILGASRRAADLTRKLLAFSRRGRQVVSAVDLHHILDAVLGLLERSIDRSIAIRRTWAAELPVVQGDAAELQNALLNLCLNARDAMPQGGELAIATADRHLDLADCQALVGFELTPGPYLAITVRDSGIGIPADALPRIFEPFFTTKPVGQGTGLGLSAVFGTAVAHHGAITVASAPGAGATFTLLLPVDPQRQRRDRVSSGPRPALRGGGTVLLVEDEEIVRELSMRVLASIGCTAQVAADGETAEAILARDPQAIDAVILDLVMPGRGGVATFHCLRALRPDLPIVLCSGYARDAAIEALLACGRAAFVQKPYRLHELAAALAQVRGGG